MPEGVVRFLLDEPKAHPLVDAAGGVEHVVRPERDLLVAGPSGEANAFFHQAAPDAKPACLRLDEQKSQPGDLLRLLDQEDTAHVFAVSLRHPATFQFRIVLPDELRHDLRHERLEPFIPAVFSGVEDAVAMDDTAHVTRFVGPQKVGAFLLSEEPLDSTHRPDQAFLLCHSQAPQHRADVTARARVERGESLQALLRKPQETAPAVGFRGSLVDQAILLEITEKAAQVASIQSQLLAELTRRCLLTVGQLEENAYLGQGEPTLQIPFPQHADLPGPEPVETPHDSHTSIEIVAVSRHDYTPHVYKYCYCQLIT